MGLPRRAEPERQRERGPEEARARTRCGAGLLRLEVSRSAHVPRCSATAKGTGAPWRSREVRQGPGGPEGRQLRREVGVHRRGSN